jgi:hypothetical protein
MSTTIESLQIEIASNSKRAVNGIDALIESLGRLKKATGGGAGLGAVSGDLNKLNTSLSKTSRSFGDVTAKTNAVGKAFKKVASFLKSAIEQSNDYVENMNLFTVSMGKYADSARKYAEIVGDLMGTDPSEWMRNQGVFMTLATGFGIAGDRASVMSQQLTQLGYDLSSFFNIDVEDAMQKLQSGISGELEPLRRLGYDLSQAKLEATAMALGIDKSVSSMTQAEKAQLRYYAIMTQVTTAQGDMARTLDQPANQIRILKAEFAQAARAIGNIFIPALQAVLPYVIAATKVIRILANSIASLVGYEMPEIDNSGMDSVASSTEESLDKATDSAKKLKSYMMGFDELNVINPNSDSEDSDLASQFNFELPTYKFMDEKTESRVNELVEKMKEWLGISGEIKSWADLLDTRLGDILKTVGLIGAGMALWKVADSTIESIKILKALLESPAYSIVVGMTLAIVGFTLEAEGIDGAIENGLDGFNFAEIVGGGLLGTGGSAWLGSQIATWINTAFTSGAVDLAITQAGINLGVGTTAAAGAALGGGVAGIIAGIPAYFVGIYSACVEGIDWLSGLLVGVGATAAGAGIGVIIGACGGPIGAGIGALIGLAVGAITDLVILIVQNWDVISKFFVDMWRKICKVFAPIAEWFYNTVIVPIIGFFAPIVEAILSVGQLVYEKIAEIVVGVANAVTSIVLKVKEIFLKIVEICVALGKAFYTYIVDPIVEFIVSLAKKIYDKVICPVKEVLMNVGTWVYDHLIAPIVSKLVWLKDKAVGLFKSVGTVVVDFVSNMFKSIINGILSAIERTINGFIRMLNGAIGIINGIPGVNITKVELLSIPRLAEGGFPETGQMFIAREAGAEMVGTIGRKTAVANNDQIVSGIANGVAEANSEQNVLLREQNSLLRALLEKESGTYLDGRSLTKSVEKYQRERGRVLLTGGAY